MRYPAWGCPLRHDPGPSENILTIMCASAQSSRAHGLMIQSGGYSSSPTMITCSTRPGIGDGELFPGFFLLSDWRRRTGSMGLSSSATGKMANTGTRYKAGAEMQEVLDPLAAMNPPAHRIS